MLKWTVETPPATVTTALPPGIFLLTRLAGGIVKISASSKPTLVTVTGLKNTGIGGEHPPAGTSTLGMPEILKENVPGMGMGAPQARYRFRSAGREEGL